MPNSSNETSNHPGKPPRLDTIFSRYTTPLFFVTFNTADRSSLLANEPVHLAFRNYATRGKEMARVYVGRYVLMPDHTHLFVTGNDEFDLGLWIRGLKRAMSKAIQSTDSEHWQPGFFDHLMRSDESYEGKCQYVRNNPVRAGLVKEADDWPYQAEIASIGSI